MTGILEIFKIIIEVSCQICNEIITKKVVLASNQLTVK